MKAVAAGRTDVGKRREHNEDKILVAPKLALFVVCDGMGGHQAGDVASALAVTSLKNYFEATVGADAPTLEEDKYAKLSGSAKRLVAGIRKANGDVHEISRTHREHKGMGSTIVAVVVDDAKNEVHIAHVGDSRVYRVREGEIELLTRDHSLVNDIAALQKETPGLELLGLPKNVITRALGMKETVDVDIKTEALVEDDVYLLCSDGLSGMLSDAQIAEGLLVSATLEDAVEVLVAMANDAGGNDNISALAVRVGETNVPRCPKCSARWHEGNGFCVNCGHKGEPKVG